VESTEVGIIVDSSLIIAAERSRHSVREILEQIQATHGEIEIGLSVITVAELVHGAYRSKSPEQQQGRLAFIERLCLDVPVYAVTLAIARVAGHIKGQQQAKGIEVALADLLIGATALHLDYAVATLNARHFQQIPDLSVL
jgi:tRNA(fMet)-specific endonuclease VapC